MEEHRKCARYESAGVYANANATMPMPSHDAEVPESQRVRVREPGSRALPEVEPVWIMAGDRVEVEEMNCQIVWILDVVYRDAVQWW